MNIGGMYLFFLIKERRVMLCMGFIGLKITFGGVQR
jgi:hypothetical protein